ncbi:membrane protein [Aureimonas sp. SA4125]|uniref:DMT family transporter n=1 Tax=Aureimonas sp. SA4125 TaxID=2826993 RepID=UPI001CC3DEEE|nr:DMT family transporter [Aureimonas sp. SA4125]BDA85307.1 membrane protein [Aureimonas sp. SA4125]
MPSLPSPPMSANLRAGLCMLAAMAAFVVNDSLVKLASSDMGVAQIMAVRGVMATAILTGLAVWQGALCPLGTMLRPMLLLRTLADILATLTYISALRSLPLANTTAIFQALPLAVTLGAALFFGERVGWRRWTAILVGFLGVMIIVRPGLEGFTVASIYVLLSVVCAATRDLATRRLPKGIPSLYISMTTALAVSITGWALLPFDAWRPMAAPQFLTLGGAAVLITIGYFFIVEAMRGGDISFVAPFRYSVLVFALLIGIVGFGERPDGFVVLGSLIIVGSGVYTLYRERVRGGSLPATTSLPAEAGAMPLVASTSDKVEPR